VGLFCEVNSGVLAVTYGTVAVHELTAVWDVTYADGRREVTPAEQYVHGFLGRVPLMATVLLRSCIGIRRGACLVWAGSRIGGSSPSVVA